MKRTRITRRGPKPKPLYICVPCDAEIGARAVRTHRSECPGWILRPLQADPPLEPNQKGPRKPGPRPKPRYLCKSCLIPLSETQVRTHHRDCPGEPDPALSKRWRPPPGKLCEWTLIRLRIDEELLEMRSEQRRQRELAEQTLTNQHEPQPAPPSTELNS